MRQSLAKVAVRMNSRVLRLDFASTTSRERSARRWANLDHFIGNFKTTSKPSSVPQHMHSMLYPCTATSNAFHPHSHRIGSVPEGGSCFLDVHVSDMIIRPCL